MCRNHAAIRRNDLEYSATVSQKRPDIQHRTDTRLLRGMPQCAAIMPRWQTPPEKTTGFPRNPVKPPGSSVFTGNRLLPERGNAGTQEAAGTG